MNSDVIRALMVFEGDEFVRRVQDEIGDGLSKNGLELEPVSLSELDQTDRKYFNPQNAFDAQGLTLLTEMIETRAKQRNVIERDTEVAIKQKDLEAEQQKLTLSKEEEFARLEQQREIEVRRAEQNTSIAEEQIDRERQAKEAEIAAKQQIELAQLAFERNVEEERITKDQLVKEKEISRAHALELAEIEKGRLSQENKIIADQAMVIAERTFIFSQILQEAINVSAIIAAVTPTHCLRERRSFKISQASITVAAGYIEASTAEMSSRPVWAAKAYNVVPAVSKMPARQTIG
jgi:uncharacterized membrane protein YqiK